MTLTQEINEQLNEQIGMEYASFWLYRAMSCWAEERNWPGFGHWLRLQSEEERQHAERLIKYIIDRSGVVRLGELAKPPCEWDSLAALFEQAYQQEKTVTEAILKRLALCEAAGDRATVLALDWFVTEQVEEEKQTEDICSRLGLIGQSPSGILILDAEMAARRDDL